MWYTYAGTRNFDERDVAPTGDAVRRSESAKGRIRYGFGYRHHMKTSSRMLLDQIAKQASLRPVGVWDFMAKPDPSAENASEEAKEFERLWALAEREAFAAGEIPKQNSVAN